MADPTTGRSNPYVGPRTFARADRGRFFGRDREARELLSLVISQRLVLFYAQSGAGKSSLINTRLAPDLEEAGFAVLPVARVGGELPAGAAVDNAFLYNVMISLDKSSRDPGRLAHVGLGDFLAGLTSDDGATYYYDETVALEAPGEAAPGEAVAEPAPALPAAGETYAEPNYVLIIDQFEEIFTSHQGRWQERAAFFEQLDAAMRADRRLWVVLSLREDYVAALDPYAPLLTDKLRARYYMERMGLDAALQAIRQPAELGGRPFAEGVAEELAENLSLVRVPGREEPQPSPYVEPVQLQVVCYQLWEQVRDKPGDKIAQSDLALGYIDQALTRFYEEALAEALAEPAAQAAGVGERGLRNWFDRELLTATGIRNAVLRDEGTGRTGSLPNVMVDRLGRRYLLRSEPRAGGVWVELVHDRFVEPIREANRAWLAQHETPLGARAESWGAAPREQKPYFLLVGPPLEEAKARLARSPDELSRLEQNFILESEAVEKRHRELQDAETLVKLERDKYLSEAGWGIILAADEDPARAQAIRLALKPLLDLRRDQATLKDGRYYHEFTGEKGYRQGETARQFLARQGCGPGQTDPARAPYYLLLVGDPEAIAYEFQHQMDVSHAVGRIWFSGERSEEDFARYARSVVEAETGIRTLERKVALFAPTNRDDPATLALTNGMIKPLGAWLEAERIDWPVKTYTGVDATKAALRELLGGAEAPALLWAGGSGMTFPRDSPDRQINDQGALICQDWSGKRGSPRRGDYFSADDLAAGAMPHGLIMVCASDYSAGTPAYNDLEPATGTGSARRPILARHAFVARLPQRLLAHPNGGALAVIGRVSGRGSGEGIRADAPPQPDAAGYASTRASTWGAGAGAEASGVPLEIMQQVLSRLLDGYPVGATLDPLNRLYAELVTGLSSSMTGTGSSSEETQESMEQAWRTVVQARGWVVVGDPAVRLMVAGMGPKTEILRTLYDIDAQMTEGARLARAGDLAGAEARYFGALALDPGLRIVPLELVQQGHIRALLERARRAAGDGSYEEAVGLFQRARELDPQLQLDPEKEAGRLLAPAMARQAREAVEAGEVDRARGLYREARRLDPTLKVYPRREIRRAAPALVLKGRAKAEAGDLQGALALFDEAKKLDPKRATHDAGAALLEIGESRARQGDIAWAVSLFQQAVAIDPSLSLDPQKKAGQLRASALVEEGRRLVRRGEEAEALAAFEQASQLDPDLRLDPEAEMSRAPRLLPSFGLKAKLWKPGQALRIRFLDGTPEQRAQVIPLAREWTRYANIRFVFGDDPDAEIRISFDPGMGAWSYLGTDALNIARNEATMNLGWIDGSSVLKQFGHLLGLINEHQQPNADLGWNEEAVRKSFQGPPNYWTKEQVELNILRKYDPDEMAVVKEFDPKSIMMYSFPAEWSRYGVGTGMNESLSEMDKEAIAELYPGKEGDSPDGE